MFHIGNIGIPKSKFDLQYINVLDLLWHYVVSFIDGQAIDAITHIITWLCGLWQPVPAHSDGRVPAAVVGSITSIQSDSSSMAVRVDMHNTIAHQKSYRRSESTQVAVRASAACVSQLLRGQTRAQLSTGWMGVSAGPE